MRRGLLAGLGSAALSLALMGAAPAQAAVAYTVTPAFQTANLDAQGSADVSVEITNHTAFDQSFKLTAADFGSLNETGGVAFLGAPTSELSHPYGLVSWLQLGSNVVFVPAGEAVTVHASVQNRESLAPGGHYGAILATAVSDDTGQAKNVAPQVGLHAVLSSLILLTKAGGANPDLRLLSQSSSHSVFQLPMKITQRFQNAGNVHVVPRGIIEIKDPSGRVVARGALNEDSVFILPESFRLIPVTLRPVAHAWVPGRYTITTVYNYEGIDTTKSFTETVWYAGGVLVLVSWLVLVSGVIVGGWWLWRRRHPQKRAKS
ncbi:hypothetical protein HJC99_04450 [Candidatus Saccharibacteria bacterium]|nr:hypothetical protein [Candidatus Saccharibacteria bacterium]